METGTCSERPDRNSELVERVMAKFSSSDGLSLHYTDTGSGLPLLCLPGLTRTGEDFRYVARHLTRCRVITMDMRGRGGSDWDPNWQNYKVPVECQDILGLLDHLNLERVAILGTSRGGLQAMGLAATVPERLLGVALNDIGPELDTAGLGNIMTYLGRRPNARTHNEAARALRAASVGFVNVPEQRWLEEAQLHFVQDEKGLDITYDPALRKAVEVETDIPDLWPFFDALQDMPLCALRGSGSNLFRADTFQKMCTKRPDMVATEVQDRGHVPFLDEPEALDALNTWMDKML